MIDALGQARAIVVRERLGEEGAERCVELLVRGSHDRSDGRIGNQTGLDGREAGVGHGRIAGGVPGRGLGGRVVGQIDAGDIGAKGAGVDDLGGPASVGHRISGGQRGVSMAGSDHVDARHVPCQLHVFAGGTAGVRSGVGESDDHVDACSVSQPVDQVLDGGVPG